MLSDTLKPMHTNAKWMTCCVLSIQVISRVNAAVYVQKVEVDDVSSAFSTFSSTYRCSMLRQCKSYRKANNKTWSDHGRKSDQYYCAYSWKKKVYCNTFDPPPPSYDTSIFKKPTCEERTEGRNGMTKKDEYLYLQGSVIDSDVECNRPSLLWTLFASDASSVYCNFILGMVFTSLSIVLLMM